MALDVESIFPTARTGGEEFFVQEAEEALRPRIAVKSANESVINSITVQDDDELFMPLSAQQTYEFELLIGFDTDHDLDPGIRLTFTVPAGSTGSFYLDEFDSFDVISPPVQWTQSKWAPFAFGDELDGGENTIVPAGTRIRGTVKTGNITGNLQLKWAQKTTDADPTIVFANSTLKVTRK